MQFVVALHALNISKTAHWCRNVI